MVETAPEPVRKQRAKTAIIAAVLMIAAFLAGYVPKHLEASRSAEALRESQRALRLATLHRQLGLASLEAEELDLSDRPRTRLALEAYASSAPEIMTQLNLGNPAMKERLASLYLTMHGVIERKQ